jgi:hypothetical protein
VKTKKNEEKVMKNTTMRGLALYGNREAKVIDVPLPEPEPGQIRVKVMTAGICGSDLHFYNDTPEHLGIRRGVVIGHEPSVIVDKLGAGVDTFSVEDRVTVNHTLGCGRCEYCMESATVLCDEFIGMAAAAMPNMLLCPRHPATDSPTISRSPTSLSWPAPVRPPMARWRNSARGEVKRS